MRQAWWAFAAALLFGATSPLAKMLIDRGVPGLELAGVVYAGAALGLVGIVFVRARMATGATRERDPAPTRRDLGILLIAALLGGVAAPVLQMIGLSRTSGMSASLLFNLEAPFTAGLAVVFLGERLGVHVLAGGALVLVGGAILAAGSGHDGQTTLAGAAAIAGCSLGWALDNNVTTRVAHRDSLRVARFKCAVAAPLSFAIAAAARPRATWGVGWTGVRLAEGLVLGVFGYGVSLACYIRSLRELGAARTGALFAVAPFIGAVMTVPLLGERPTWLIGGAGAVMAIGAYVITREHPATA